MIVAGEASGDLHAANLVKAIKQLNPRVQFFGLGGELMQKEGVDLYCDITRFAVVGFFEVIKNLPKFKSIFAGILEKTKNLRPDLAILVDYPGFNLRLAKELKKQNIPIIYYISPQVWAWGEGRINTIKKLIDRMIVVFKFEEELYVKNDIPVSFVGHPLLDIVKPDISREELFKFVGFDPKETTIALLPGSREKEVKTLLPVMLKTADLINKKIENCQFLLIKAATVKEILFKKRLSYYNNLKIKTLSGVPYAGIAASDFAIVASGTATLETAILGIPLVILYKVSFLTWACLRSLIKIPYIGLVNVVKKEKIIEEFIQYNAKPQRIAEYIVDTITNKNKFAAIKQNLSSCVGMLGEKGASLRAAEVIIDFLNK